MRITNAGKFGFNSTTPGANTYLFAGQITGGVSAGSVVATPAVQSNVTTAANVFRSDTTTQAAAFTLASLRHFSATQGTIGAGSAVTDQLGFSAESTLIGATNNYGFHSNIASGTGRWNFYAAGTAANVFAGTTSIGGAVGSESLRATPVASAVNYLNVSGAVTTASPSLSAAGSDTNIDLALTPKGTGVLSFGTHTAGIVAQAGYITIKDAGGTTRRLLVG
jgi:hypothetical protein